jgi:hypothetical protein
VDVTKKCHYEIAEMSYRLQDTVEQVRQIQFSLGSLHLTHGMETAGIRYEQPSCEPSTASKAEASRAIPSGKCEQSALGVTANIFLGLKCQPRVFLLKGQTAARRSALRPRPLINNDVISSSAGDGQMQKRVAFIGDAFVDVQTTPIKNLPRWGQDETVDAIHLLPGTTVAPY